MIHFDVNCRKRILEVILAQSPIIPRAATCSPICRLVKRAGFDAHPPWPLRRRVIDQTVRVIPASWSLRVKRERAVEVEVEAKAEPETKTETKAIPSRAEWKRGIGDVTGRPRQWPIGRRIVCPAPAPRVLAVGPLTSAPSRIGRWRPKSRIRQPGVNSGQTRSEKMERKKSFSHYFSIFFSFFFFFASSIPCDLSLERKTVDFFAEVYPPEIA